MIAFRLCGQLRRGTYAGYYITCLDFDSKEAFDKFCEILGTTSEDLAKWTKVEWHGSLERRLPYFKETLQKPNSRRSRS
jgi:hypothetical protein